MIRIRLGVTGLRLTGETVFLTALIHHLEMLGNSSMKALRRADKSGRVEIRPAIVHPPRWGKASRRQ